MQSELASEAREVTPICGDRPGACRRCTDGEVRLCTAALWLRRAAAGRTPKLKAVRLIALTGYGLAEDRERALAAGFDAHLVKPVDLMALERALAAISSGQ